MTDTSVPDAADPQLKPRKWRASPLVVIGGAIVIVAVIAAIVWGSVVQQQEDDHRACMAGRGFWDIALGGNVAEHQDELKAISAACDEQVYGD